jgi:hypothetical protein
MQDVKLIRRALGGCLDQLCIAALAPITQSRRLCLNTAMFSLAANSLTTAA